MYKRPIYPLLLKRIKEQRRFIQVLAGPRQTGKTTLARQLMEEKGVQCHYATADEAVPKASVWIEQQWETARLKMRGSKQRFILILDEIQKISHWSEAIKKLWDEDSNLKLPLHVILLGSSPLLVQKGLTESLAGRFEIIPITHWSFVEMEAAFGWDINQYIFYGGYPGSAALINEPHRWSSYIMDSLIETSISKDILLMTRVDKPALLRRLFELGCIYSSQILSYQKMLGQLQDAGNTVTLAHYLKLLDLAGLLTGLSKYAGQKVRQRSSSPKFQVQNNALLSAQLHLTFDEAFKEKERWGHLVESAVGSALINGSKGKGIEVFYWLHHNREVDYVLARGKQVIAIEVKSGRKKPFLSGMEKFGEEFNVQRKLLIGDAGIPLKEFLKIPVEELFI
ncbi:MAG: AAA family ATPase [Endomicrobiales bacterium]|nr:AAA family ATPase [Endomicrobiales bacterium]